MLRGPNVVPEIEPMSARSHFFVLFLDLMGCFKHGRKMQVCEPMLWSGWATPDTKPQIPSPSCKWQSHPSHKSNVKRSKFMLSSSVFRKNNTYSPAIPFFRPFPFPTGVSPHSSGDPTDLTGQTGVLRNDVLRNAVTGSNHLAIPQ